MQITERVEVKQVPKDAVERLNRLAKQAGYKSRSAFLKDKLLEISLDQLELEASEKYSNLIYNLERTIIDNSKVMSECRDVMDEMLLLQSQLLKKSGSHRENRIKR
jgi:metal-responsive CopG/Arc/MetJ family transcriptional regulator